MRQIRRFLIIFVATCFALSTSQAQTQITSCNTQFIDSGGESGSYLNNENTDWLICPDTLTEYLELEFTLVDIETATNLGVNNTGCKDILFIYDGMDDMAPLVGSYCGEESGTGQNAFVRGHTLRVSDKFKPTNSSGCFYLKFQSDNEETRSGWQASVYCCVPSLDNPITDGIDVPYATNGGNDFELLIDNNCIRKGDLSMFTDFKSSGSTCKTAGLTLPNKSFFAFETNENGGFMEILAEPLDSVGEIEMLVFGPVTLDSASYSGGVINDCVSGENPWSSFFNAGPNQTYILGVATELSGRTSVKTLPSSVGVGGVLPVTIVSYNIKMENRKAKILWSTASEINNHGFEIYRSFDGKLFTIIDWVDSQSKNNEGHSYSFIDTPNRTGIIYYYIKQLDLDGLSTDFDVLKVNFESEKEVYSFPNPSNGHISITTGKTQSDQSSIIRIYDQIGKLKLTDQISNNEPVDLSFLESGIYTIQIIKEGNTYTHQHIISK
ncbi:MAG: hypothetical protein ACJA1A_000055 [Saprospiraceae bacterium]|jgi:hypothetical protein